MKELLDYVKVYDDIVSHEVCDQLLEVCANSEWTEGKTVDGVSGSRICNVAFIRDKEVDAMIFGLISKAFSRYKSDFKWFNPTSDEGYVLLKYENSGRYNFHTDQHQDYNRQVTTIINLNDDYEGGELAIIDDSYKIDMKKGDVIVFPSNFQYPHAIKPIVSGTRYSMITWAS